MCLCVCVRMRSIFEFAFVLSLPFLVCCLWFFACISVSLVGSIYFDVVKINATIYFAPLSSFIYCANVSSTILYLFSLLHFCFSAFFPLVLTLIFVCFFFLGICSLSLSYVHPSVCICALCCCVFIFCLF